MLEIVLTVFCFVFTFRMSLESNKLPLWGVKLSQQPITKVSIAYFSQGWEFAQIAQFKWATVSSSLRSLRTNEQLWANRSGRSCQKSDCEQIAQVAHQKWAMWANRKSLRLLTKNEWPWANRLGLSLKISKWANRSFFELIPYSLIFSQKTSNLLRKPMSEFPALPYYM